MLEPSVRQAPRVPSLRASLFSRSRALFCEKVGSRARTAAWRPCTRVTGLRGALSRASRPSAGARRGRGWMATRRVTRPVSSHARPTRQPSLAAATVTAGTLRSPQRLDEHAARIARIDHVVQEPEPRSFPGGVLSPHLLDELRARPPRIVEILDLAA